MDESRRFLRHVMPGLVFAVEVIVWLFVVFPCWTRTEILQLGTTDSLGVALGGLLASGALGYIFATVHHWWHWHFDIAVLDHSPNMNSLSARGLLPGQLNNQTFKREEALAISLALWHERVKKDGNGSIGDAANDKVVSLGDRTHGLGTARVASIFALFVVALMFFSKIGTAVFPLDAKWRFAFVLLMGIATIWLFDSAYRQVGRLVQAIYDKILEDALTTEQPRKNAD